MSLENKPVPEAGDARVGIRRTKLIPVVLGILAVLAAIILGAFRFLARDTGTAPAVQTAPPLPPPAAPVPELRRQAIPRGSNLGDILAKLDWKPADIHRLKEEVKPVYDLARIKAGHEMRFYTLPGGDWTSIEYDIDENRYLVIRNDNGRRSSEIKEYPFEVRPSVLWGTIEDNPISAVNRAGEGDVLALQLADLFGWDIDFYTDIRPGDGFKIVFEKKYLNSEFSGYGDILAAEFTNQGHAYRAFRFTCPDTKSSDYYDPEGNSLRKEFLRSPFKYSARVTSRFSHSRFHPIRRIYRPHHGVDYGAPVGTPVRATAGGTVMSAGWNGGAGRMIKIRHANAYETMYLHLKGFATGIHAGAKVKGGQTIGYVGSSGESTGPHLDYRIIHHGKYINPLGWRFRPAEPLRKEFLETFKKDAESLTRALNAPLVFYAVFRSGCPGTF